MYNRALLSNVRSDGGEGKKALIMFGKAPDFFVAGWNGRLLGLW